MGVEEIESSFSSVKEPVTNAMNTHAMNTRERDGDDIPMKLRVKNTFDYVPPTELGINQDECDRDNSSSSSATTRNNATKNNDTHTIYDTHTIFPNDTQHGVSRTASIDNICNFTNSNSNTNVCNASSVINSGQHNSVHNSVGDKITVFNDGDGDNTVTVVGTDFATNCATVTDGHTVGRYSQTVSVTDERELYDENPLHREGLGQKGR